MSSETSTASDAQVVEKIAMQIGCDLGMIIDREMEIGSIETERIQTRVAGEDLIHISFRLEFQVDGKSHQGCLLMPLPDAVSVACYLMVMPDEGVKLKRESKQLDRATKDAMLEVGNFVGGSSDAVVRKSKDGPTISARSIGCQGVAPGSIPNFAHLPESELILGRIEATLGEFEPFEMILMLPAEIFPSE